MYNYLQEKWNNNYNCKNSFMDNCEINNNHFEKTVHETKKASSIYARFGQKYETVYVYGAGKIAKKIHDLLERDNIKIDGFVVSSGHRKQDYFGRYPVYEIDDLQLLNHDVGIIIALNKKNTREVVPQIVEMPFSGILFYHKEII